MLCVGCLTSQQLASASQGRICSHNCTCYHTETGVADQSFCLTQSQYTDTMPTTPITPGAWQGSHWCTNFEVTGKTRPGKHSTEKAGIEPRSAALETDAMSLGQRSGRTTGAVLVFDIFLVIITMFCFLPPTSFQSIYLYTSPITRFKMLKRPGQRRNQ